MSLHVGQLLDHYRVVGKLGEGGMGEVWRAWDERLDREVAVKVLPSDVTDDADRLARFEREAKALAALSHPNILAIYDFGKDQGISFAVTELLEGESLRELVIHRRLDWRKAVDIMARVADGLAAAHSRGVVHRDLKPENLFLTSDGRVKILDFGLARMSNPDAASSGTTRAPTRSLSTDPGTILGTVGYMSPEQVRGNPANPRSDIFSFGCVAYEMLTGQRAFARETAAEAMTAILREEPEDISSAGVAVPAEMEAVLRRCLEKRPESRFQSAGDLAYTLRAVASVTASISARSLPRVRRWGKVAVWATFAVVIVLAVTWMSVLRAPPDEQPAALSGVAPNRVAVVPLENRTGDSTFDAVGVLAADLIVQRFTETAVAEVVPLAEASPVSSSSEPGRDWGHDLELARQRGADLVVSGAMYLEGENLRLQARLADTAAGNLVYAFEPVVVARQVAATGIDTLRERVVAAVAAHGNPMIDITLVRPPSTYEAYKAHQRGEALFSSDIPQAIVHFEAALAKDPLFHFARIQAVWSHMNIRDFTGSARELRVLEEQLDRLTPFEETYVRYQRSVLEWDRVASLRLLRGISEFAPGMFWVLSDIPWRAMELNRPREALDALERYGLLKGSSGDWWPLAITPAAHHMLGDFEGELESAILGLERFPDMAHFYSAKARALAAMGRMDALNEVVNAFLRVQTDGASAGALMSVTALELRAHGFRDDAMTMAMRAVKWYEDHPSELAEESSGFAVELWVLGYPEEKRSFANALCLVGRWSDAADFIARLIETEPSEYQLSGWLGVIGVISAPESRRISDSLSVSGSGRAAAWGTYWKAAIAAHLGDEETAIELLAEAFAKGFPYGVYLHSALELEPLWDHPGFVELIEPRG